jgi:hypothetical protein
MMMMKKIYTMVLSICLISFAYAQQGETATQPAVIQPAVAQPIETQPAMAQPSVEVTTNDEFQKTERLENLRYRHLWIAYALIWLAVFGFMWKTWRKSVEQEEKIADLNQKINQLEKK